MRLRSITDHGVEEMTRKVRHGTAAGYRSGCRCNACVDNVRDSNLRRNYGLTLREYRGMLVNQESRCAACLVEVEDWQRNLSVDHDHLTGQVRGLLCQPCNLALGHLKDDPERIFALADYLRRTSFGPGWSS